MPHITSRTFEVHQVFNSLKCQRRFYPRKAAVSWEIQKLIYFVHIYILKFFLQATSAYVRCGATLGSISWYLSSPDLAATHIKNTSLGFPRTAQMKTTNFAQLWGWKQSLRAGHTIKRLQQYTS